MHAHVYCALLLHVPWDELHISPHRYMRTRMGSLMG